MERELNKNPDGLRKDTPYHRDSGKPPMMLLQLASLWLVAKVAQAGTKKYGKRNWEEHANDWEYSQLWDSALRHMIKWALGRETDDGPGGTGQSHISCAIWNLLSLSELSIRKLGKDDRSSLPNDLLKFLDE